MNTHTVTAVTVKCLDASNLVNNKPHSLFGVKSLIIKGDH